MRIRTLHQLAKAADQRRATIWNGSILPARVVLNMPGPQILLRLNSGMKVYQKKTVKAQSEQASAWYKGQEIRMTQGALRRGFDGRSKSSTGIYIGPSMHNKGLIHVQRHGLKTIEIYHQSFWKPNR